MRPKFEYGEAVRVIRSLRNDGTYPGKPTGRLLIKRGSVGYVRDVGTYLQNQLIYSVDFVDSRCIVGCREEELQLQSDPWMPTRFEFRDRATPRIPLAVRGEVIARPGDAGEIERVVPGVGAETVYQVRFHGRTFQIPESALDCLAVEVGEQR
ncbi:MAG: nitrogen fixation protein NifZ [Gammaproteobacteria bacterium]|nr:nitrogen fixation protein NifZ [Gammaproteobacteria bacterium]MCB1880228.1 nitrogen fixation protein NifZ [Gammaproteobacteria bacterium]